MSVVSLEVGKYCGLAGNPNDCMMYEVYAFETA